MTSMMASISSLKRLTAPEDRTKSHVMTQQAAVATSLVAMVPTGLGGTLINTAQGNVHFKLGAILAMTSSAAMYLTATYVAPEIQVDFHLCLPLLEEEVLFPS